LNEIAGVTDASRQLLPETVDEISAMSHDANRRLLDLFGGPSNKTDPFGRRLLSMPADDDTATDDHSGRRRILSIQADGIADMSAEINGHLLAAELPDKLAGRRQLLSTTITQIIDMTAGIKGQLDAINSTASAELSHRVLTTSIVGTFDELDDVDSAVPSGDFPEWLPASQRRLLQLSSPQKPNAVVAQDGSGDFKTINEAVNAIPKGSSARYAIYVKAGDYKEYVTITKDMANVVMYGDGPTKTRVIGDKSNTGGFATIATRTFCKLSQLSLPLTTQYGSDYSTTL
jgi:hypothetical protein